MYCEESSALEFTDGNVFKSPSTPPESEATCCASLVEISIEVKSVTFTFPFF